MAIRSFVASRPGRPARRARTSKGHLRERKSRINRIVDAVHAVLFAVWQALVVTPTAYVCAVFYALFLSRTSHRIVLRLFLLLLLQGACVLTAVLAFFSFYHAWVPEVALAKDVWFNYGENAANASVPLRPGHEDLPVWREEPEVDLFMVDQPYDVSLELRFDTDEETSWLGNFMVDLQLLNHNDTILYKSSRPGLCVIEPGILRWISRLYRVLTQPVLSEPLAPLQVVRVPLLREIVPYASASGRSDDPHFVRTRGYKATQANLKLRFRGLSPIVSLEHATLRFHAYLTGLPYVYDSYHSYLMFHYPLFSFCLFLLLFSGIEFVPWTATMSLEDQEGASSLTAELDAAFRLASEAGKGSDAGPRAMGLLGQVAHAVDALGIVSVNDRLDEISTPSLRVLLIPSMQAYLENATVITEGEDRMCGRKSHVQASLGAARLFFTIMRRYEVLPPAVRALLQPHMQPEGAEPIVRNPAERRMVKIQSFKLERAVQQQLDAFRQAFRAQARAPSAGPSDVFFDLLVVPNSESADEDADDEQSASGDLPPVRTLRAYLQTMCVLHALRCASLLESALQELELLEHVPPPKPSDGASDATDDAWRLDSHWFSKASGPLLSETGKPLRPFVITPAADKPHRDG
ncbi:hypothetical protein MCAP1_002767 [Malassezia caprae]|uniref:Uncharacterized protein n=1 Tax=Malassezia caprae TaxID=1381934 RepID=A0AAF0ECY9_9BASI|nr:hypothetical protein MCAP1_002767 [Malassezia caprae]